MEEAWADLKEAQEKAALKAELEVAKLIAQFARHLGAELAGIPRLAQLVAAYRGVPVADTGERK